MAAAVLTGASRRRLLAAAPAPEPAVVLPSSVLLEPVAPSRRAGRHGRRSPTLWVTVGTVTVGAVGALAYVRLAKDDQGS
jgi:hypothetical protein